MSNISQQREVKARPTQLTNIRVMEGMWRPTSDKESSTDITKFRSSLWILLDHRWSNNTHIRYFE